MLYLGSKCNLRKQIEYLAAHLELLPDEVYVNLGLAACGHTVQQAYALGTQQAVYAVQRGLLGRAQYGWL